MSEFDKLLLSKIKVNGAPIEIRIRYDEKYKEWSVLLRNKTPDLLPGDWWSFGEGKSFRIDEAVEMAFNEADRRGY